MFRRLKRKRRALYSTSMNGNVGREFEIKSLFSAHSRCYHRNYNQSFFPFILNIKSTLESEEQQKSHHKTEETHGLGKGESQNGVREELLLEGRISGVADDEGTEDGADTGTGSSHANGSCASADVLGRRIDIHSARRRLERADCAERGCHSRVACEQGRGSCRGSGDRHLRTTYLSGSCRRCGRRMASQCRSGDWGDKVLSVGEHDWFLFSS